MRKKRQPVKLKTRLEIVKSHELGMPIKDIKRVYSVTACQINNFLKQADRLKKIKKNEYNKFSLHPGPKRKNEEVYPLLMDEFISKRDAKKRVPRELLQVKLTQLLSSNTQDPPSDNAIYYRVIRWMDKEDIVIRSRTHLQQVKNYNKDLMKGFFDETNLHIKLMKYKAYQIVNSDETNLYFNLPGNTTCAVKGSKDVIIKDQDSGKRCTVFLSVSMEGKIPPYVIWKGSDGPRGRIIKWFANGNCPEAFPNSMQYHVQESAWMDTKGMNQWYQKVWIPYLDFIKKKTKEYYISEVQFVDGLDGVEEPEPPYNEPAIEKSFLILDSEKQHMNKGVTDPLTQMGTHYTHIPAHYTFCLQTIDVGINAQFHKHIKRCYWKWRLINEDIPSTQRNKLLIGSLILGI